MTVERPSYQTTLQSIDTQNTADTLVKKLISEESEVDQKSEVKPSKEEMDKLVKGINDFVKTTSTHIQFELHEKLNEYYVTIVDDHTKEVVREIPSKKVLDVYAAMTEFIGLLVDKKI
ncbi:flagellar protein FlaG [Metabacillus halosaccharovorans]|uniref:flagellar protein FlaG n=1 Tax=Metabacillus halosaccharovorans TaxID=930124 RepID=UPI003734C610